MNEIDQQTQGLKRAIVDLLDNEEDLQMMQLTKVSAVGIRTLAPPLPTSRSFFLCRFPSSPFTDTVRTQIGSGDAAGLTDYEEAEMLLETYLQVGKQKRCPFPPLPLRALTV